MALSSSSGDLGEGLESLHRWDAEVVFFGGLRVGPPSLSGASTLLTGDTTDFRAVLGRHISFIDLCLGFLFLFLVCLYGWMLANINLIYLEKKTTFYFSCSQSSIPHVIGLISVFNKHYLCCNWATVLNTLMNLHVQNFFR